MSEAFTFYKRCFVRNFSSYIRQKPGGTWITINRSLSDSEILNHLNRKLYIGTNGNWYVEFGFLDFDFSCETKSEQTETIGKVLDELNFQPGQYYFMTSPSWKKNGSCHLIFRPLFNGEIPTLRLFQNYFTRKVGSLCEIYPQRHKKFRLPLGLNQFIVSPEEKILEILSWEEALHFISKLDTYNIPHLSSDVNACVIDKHRNAEKSDKNEKITEEVVNAGQALLKSEELYLHGLQESHSRHRSQMALANYFFWKNLTYDEAEQEIKRWIREKHNNFSEGVKNGRWREIDGEIERAIKWVYSRPGQFQDSIGNLQAEITKSDLILAAQYYRGDAVNQKRLVEFLSYCRPRRHHDRIFIPYTEWVKIAGKKYYLDFIRDLEIKNIIEVDYRYRHNPQNKLDSYTRKFWLKINLENGAAIKKDGLNVTDFYNAWLIVCQHNVREAAEQTGIKTQRFYSNRNT